MATDDTSATIIPLHPTRPKTAAERAKAYRERKKAKAATESHSGEQRPDEREQSAVALPVPIVTPVTLGPSRAVTATVTPVTSRGWSFPTILLNLAAFGLAGVGITMNGWYGRSLGSTEAAGWLFLAIGMAADLVALAVPSCAARLWHARQRGAAVVGWALYAATFAFTVSSGIGFAAVNLSDVTASRASRVTPAVTAAQTALDDAKASRDRECRTGTGKFCRERETTVVDRQQALNAAMATVEKAADPQVEAASRIVNWVSAGILRPSGDDVAMLRLILLALLPQAGGIMLMVARPPKTVL